MFYDEVDKVVIDYVKLSIGYPMRITFHLKDKGRSSLVLRTIKEDVIVYDIEKIINCPVEVIKE